MLFENVDEVADLGKKVPTLGIYRPDRLTCCAVTRQQGYQRSLLDMTTNIKGRKLADAHARQGCVDHRRTVTAAPARGRCKYARDMAFSDVVLFG